LGGQQQGAYDGGIVKSRKAIRVDDAEADKAAYGPEGNKDA
jgi:hypothetical protein